MIRALAILAVAFNAVSGMANAKGSKVQNGACFALADRAARTCVPVEYALIDVEITAGQVWAHFEDGLATVTIYIYQDVEANSSPSGDINRVFAGSHMARDILQTGSKLEAWGLLELEETVVLEARASAHDTNTYHMEIMAPKDTMHIVVTDFSPEFDDVELDVFEVADGVRYLTYFDPSVRLRPLRELEHVSD